MGAGGGGGGEPGLYCERKCLRNNPRGQDLTLYDAFTLPFIIYVTLLDPHPRFIGYGATTITTVCFEAPTMLVNQTQKAVSGNIHSS